METSLKAALDLEWPALVAQLADRCCSTAGRARALDLQPAATLDHARVLSRRTRDAMDVAAQGDLLPIQGIPPVSEVIDRIAKEASGSSSELHGLLEMLRTAHALRRFGQSRRVEFPALAQAIFSESTLDRVQGVLDHALDPDGTLADRASSDLGPLRRKVLDMRGRVISRLDEVIAHYAEVLQDRYYTLRDGRYVIPVRSDSHLNVPGIVHGSSASGATLFVEPRSIVQLGNQLKVLIAEVEREETRILDALSADVRSVIDDVREAHEACITADLLAAMVRFAAETECIAVELDAEPVLDLRRARHPLLVLGKTPVVANDLALAAGRVLVVSGPNAGGKTVALKTFGLVALMARAGLPVPVAEGSRVGWFDPIECDVGDDQSLARNLSTFSAHVTHLAGVLDRRRSGALVLLDELAGGTDPEEGSALAASVLEALAEAGCAVAVTTHYELLKTLALRDERFQNASVGFDLATMSPTFTVTLGIPGASSALAVAQRFGIPTQIIGRARGLLPEHAGGREDVLRRLQDEELAARMARRAVEEEARQIARLRVELESEKNVLRAREQARITKEGTELLASLRRAREELRGAEARLRRKKLDEQEVREAERAINQVAREVSIGGPLSAAAQPTRAQTPVRRAPREEDLKPGTRVFVQRLGTTVEVIERSARDQVRVAAGALKLFVALDEILVEEGSETASEPSAQEGGARRQPLAPYDSAGDTARPLRTESNTCDVRGLRVDDALGMVDAFLDRVYGVGATSGFVLHGHGTGALKQAVREHLKGSPYVVRSRAADPEDGGDAFTVLWLKS